MRPHPLWSSRLKGSANRPLCSNTPMEQTDEALVQQAVALNDMQAFETLVRRHQACTL